LPGYTAASLKESVLNTLASIRSALKELGYLKLSPEDKSSGSSDKKSKSKQNDDDDDENAKSSLAIKSGLESLTISIISKFGSSLAAESSGGAPVRLYKASNGSTLSNGSLKESSIAAEQGTSEERIALAIVRQKTIAEVSAFLFLLLLSCCLIICVCVCVCCYCWVLLFIASSYELLTNMCLS
jgi:hypothetical protein